MAGRRCDPCQRDYEFGVMECLSCGRGTTYRPSPLPEPEPDAEPAMLPSPGLDKVEGWRLEQMHRLGYKEEMAELLAVSRADLRQLERLLLAGCALETAARILL